MTDTPPASSREASASAEESVISDGRYLYCLVDTTAGEPGSLSVTGIDDAPVRVVENDGVGAVVHDSETVYDTDRPKQAKRWLLTHQGVVDAASDVFGTPLPVRFDTILEDGDAGVERWLHEHSEQLSEELAAFADKWEYRIHLLWDPSGFEDRVTEEDDRLGELRQKRRQAESGTAFLVKKQYDNRLRELKRDRRAELVETLHQRVEPLVSELTEQDAHTASGDDTEDADRERVTRLAVLAAESTEDTLGARLDEIVEQDGLEIRFTGPWPPYTFVPDLGDR